MPQQTNLNVSPYFDDFDPNSGYHRVLFKPGYPVQARELTSLQSILQNQVEKFGQHFFKEGAKVIPGNTGYTRLYYCVQLENTYQGVPVSAYADQLIGTKITGELSGVTAFVDSIIFPEDSENGNLTLYVNYLSSSTANNSTQTFSDGESISCSETVTSGLLGNTVISAGSPIATTLASGASATGSSFQIENGVYFIRGHFVNVNRETLILDQYSNTPSYRIGFFINEQIVTSDLDESLNDNSQGFNNYSAPGADRLRISVSLFKKPLDDFNDDNFILLATVVDGVLETTTNRKGDLGGGPGYLDVRDMMARRTFDESGNYYVKPFDVKLVDSLSDGLGNDGVYTDGQITRGGGVANENLALYKISPGKAYVQGYEIETTTPTFIDVNKPRTTHTLEDQSIIYNTGPTFNINRVNRSPEVGFGTYFVSLRDRRVGSNQETAPGKEVGVARVYDFKLESGSYDALNGNINEWDLALYDVQTTTDITLNQADTLTIPTFVKGDNSGATGFLRYPVTAGTAVTVYETEGSFMTNEKLIFNGISNGRIAIAVTAHGISDVKSIYGTDNGVSGINTFSADVIQSVRFNVGIATISGFSGGVSTITPRNDLFPGDLIKENDIVRFTDTSSALNTTDPILARVVGVTTTEVRVTGVTTVTGICNGFLSSSPISVTDLKVLSTNFASSSDTSLYTPLPQVNVSDVDLKDASLVIRKTFSVNISGNQLSETVTADTNETFLPFDAERYFLSRSDGSTEVLTSDKFDIGPDGTTLQIYNLGSDDTGATLVATLKKLKPKSKVKIKNRVNSIIINKSKLSGSGIGATTLNNGLVYGNYPYGTRVEDETISLNTPDIIEIHGIYESADTSAASAPRMTLQTLNSQSATTAEYLIGEQIVGQTSGAIAIVAEKISDSIITYINKNETSFVEGETILSKESGFTGVISNLTSPSFKISGNYGFATGQENTFYDYGRIIRNKKSSAPVKQIKVYFSSASYDSTDDGDITTIDSYNNFNYTTEIKTIDTFRNSDIIDIRPRVADYNVSTGSRSPLEFFGRSFETTGQSATNVLASNETILTDVTYYQGRVDRIYLSKDGRFQVIDGTPSDNPQRPEPINDAIEICTIKLPPYLYFTEDADISFLDYKRYRMQDINLLENRIKSLEYYTSLSLLETATANFFVPDAEGLNRFKTGFFVDNFNSFETQEIAADINNSIDRKYSELRPRHYTNSVDLVFGPVVDVDPNEDIEFGVVEGNNIRKQSDVVTLDYAEVEFIKQSFATRTESVTPFLISFWNGTIDLTPASDNWVDTARIDARVIETEGNYTETFNELADAGKIDPQTGFGPIIWSSWETNWTGEDTTTSTSRRTIRGGANVIHRQGHGGRRRRRRTTRWVTDRTIETTFETTVRTGTASREGEQTIITEQFDRTSQGDRVVSRDLIPFMRSRNIEWVSKKVKPLTRMYAFFDGVDVSKYCVPKLLEITMVSGTFEVGETIAGNMLASGESNDLSVASPHITFRASQLNHREGPYNAPTKTFRQNPYTNEDLSAAYSSTSNILNVDTSSLSAQARGDYFGYVAEGMTLRGRTSGAIATVNQIRLISDLSATLIGSFYIPDPNITTHPRFETGTKTFTIMNNEENDLDSASTVAEEGFTSSGTLETLQETIISVRNARLETRREFQERNVEESLGTRVTGTTVVERNRRRQTVITWYDPLAQSFLVEDETGVFVTSCDVFFRTKDDMDIPVVFQLRSMQNGFPTAKILPFSEIVLDPEDIQISADGSVATNIQFDAPVYLQGGTEYAICLASNSTKYSVYISRIGENDILTDTFISNQPYLGSLFKSQNASTWEPSQWEDLKFTMYRADFLESGSIEFYSPELTEGNSQIPRLLPDPINFTSRQIRVGLGTTVSDSFENGNTFTQLGTTATGNLVGTAGSAIGDLTISNAGIGYTPSDGSFTFSGVSLVTITGNGRGATADISIRNGSIVASGATISSGGSGYVEGDVLGIDAIGAASIGRNARLTVAGTGLTNELVFDNVQGDFVVGAANTLFYTNSSGVSTELNYDNGGDVQISAINVDTDGLHFEVNHTNHGMYFSDNRVILSNVSGDSRPTTLTAEYASDSTAAIPVASVSNFGTFENVGVGTTNVGYLKIGDEIIEYEGTSGNTITGITRGTEPKTYPIGTKVHKYELNGISLQRINKTHNLTNVTESDPFTFDSYKIKLDTTSTTGDDRTPDRSSSATGYPKLYNNETKSSGGYGVRATQNMPFDIITPTVQNLTVSGTSITSEIRTITGRSFSGNEIPFVDNGFENIVINRVNYFDYPRMIASKVNEDAKLSNIAGNKSMNMRLFLNTTDSRISPVIDSQRVSAILTTNRVNNPISDYVTDSRVNTLFEDPTACKYISKEIILENPASSIKIIVAAHITDIHDIRAFYAVNNEPGLEPIFTPFPGYSNLNSRGQVIDAENNNGESDVFVPKSNDYQYDPALTSYREYVFTADQLPSFRTYRVKLNLTSTSQCFVPKIKDLRVIALA